MPHRPDSSAGDAASITGSPVPPLGQVSQSILLRTLNATEQDRIQQLADIVLTDPDPNTGVAAVSSALGAATSDPSWTVWLELLLAEAHQRNGSYWAGEQAARQAGEHASTHQLHAQALVAAGISADIAVCAQSPDAAQACIAYVQAVKTLGQLEPVESATTRMLTAGVLRAIAIYQQESCEEARRQLTVLLPPPDHDAQPAESTLQAVKAALAPMVSATLAATKLGCQPSCAPPSAPLPALPGGVLCPRLSPVATDFGAARVRHPGSGARKITHTCEITGQVPQ